MEKMDSEISAYNNTLDYRVSGTIDPDVLGKTLTFLVNRHESFRTVFPEINGTPVQVVLPSVKVEVKMTDLSKETTENKGRDHF